MKDGTSAVLPQSRMDKKLEAGSVECYCHLRNAMVECHPISVQSRLHQFGKKVLPGIFLGCELIAVRNLERKYSDFGFGRFGKVGRIRNSSSKNQREKSIDITKGRWIHIPSSRWYSKTVRKRLRFSENPLYCEDKP